MHNQKTIHFLSLFRPFLLIFTLISLVLLISACSSKPIEAKNQSKDILVYIKELNEQTGEVTFDEIEWLDHLNTERIKELGLDQEADLPSGFRIYNESEQTESLKLADGVTIEIVNGANLHEPLTIDVQELASHIHAYEPPYYLTIKDNLIIKISEKYTP